MTVQMEDARHGTRHMIRELKCKCDVCRRAVAREQNEYRLRREANGGALLVDKLGALRRVRALMVLGWPRRELSRQAGYKGDAVALILDSRKNLITVDTHRRYAELYERLSMTPGPSQETRRRALRAGWAPPLAYDNIDDPDEQPTSDPWKPRCITSSLERDDYDEAVVLRLLAYDTTVTSTRAERVEAMRRWLSIGRSEKSLCGIHGWKAGRYVNREAAA